MEANDQNIFLIPFNADHRLGSASHGQLKTFLTVADKLKIQNLTEIQEHQHDVIPHYQSKYEPSQEKHQYGKRFKDASTQYLENDINHSTIPLVATNTADQIIQQPQLFEYDRNIYEEKSVENCKKRKPVVITSKGVFILE